MVATLLIVSDIKLYCDGLERLLADEPHIRVIGTALSCDKAVAALTAVMPDIAIVDLAMRESLVTIRQIVDAAPSVKVVALTVSEMEPEVIACAEAGVSGYVTRDGSVEDLVKCVQAVASDELRCSPRVAAYLLRRVGALASENDEIEPVAPLTRRESGVLELVAQGLSNKEIARLLTIELATVKTHVHNILEKFQVHRRGEAAALARRQAVGDGPRFFTSQA